MDLEQRARRQSRRVLISEILMVVTVAITVLILGFVVSGYWVNADFEVERLGLLQVSSFPTGADVLIDGKTSWLQRTNLSKVLPVGQHTLVLSKEGYDTWEKTIEVKEGLLYRLGYPRLFLTERESEKVWTLPEDYRLVTISPDHKTMLVVTNGSSWLTVNLEDEELKPKTLEVASVFDASGEILDYAWSGDGERLLLKTQLSGQIEWILLNVKNVDLSVNLTREFKADFSEILSVNNSASVLVAVISGGLYRIDVTSRSLSPELVPGVAFYSYRNGVVAYTAAVAGLSDEIANVTGLKTIGSNYYVGLLNLSDNTIEPVFSGFDEIPRVLLSRFYDDEYISLIDRKIKIYKKDDLSLYFEGEIGFIPEMAEVGYNGEFIFTKTGREVASLDMEAEQIARFYLDNSSFLWFDKGMLATISDAEELIVYDFDGFNRRVLASGVSAGLPATISRDKWLYYFDLDKNLIRSQVAK